MPCRSTPAPPSAARALPFEFTTLRLTEKATADAAL
jgi:hypothetical protein